ncbi:HNH endonuclease [Vibrio fluvialis]|nr:HNH endonuclease [Vibrio fluvialis]
MCRLARCPVLLVQINIHIHHKVPISKFGSSKLVNPESDLVPLCANCHVIVHRNKDQTLSIEALKELIDLNS